MSFKVPAGGVKTRKGGRAMKGDTKKVKRLLIRRNNIVGSAKLIREYDANFDFERDFPQIKFRLEKLDSLWDEFNEIQAEIECEHEISDELADERIEFETIYFELKGSLASKLGVTNTSSPIPASPVAPPTPAFGVRLPEIKIPEFNGNFDEWLNFHDLFNTLIHTSTQLSPIQKFQYLKAVLKGDALRLVQSLAVSSANYMIAWDLLKQRYDNKNYLIKQHLSALLSTPFLKRESSAALSGLADTFEKHLVQVTNCTDSSESVARTRSNSQSATVDESSLSVEPCIAEQSHGIPRVMGYNRSSPGGKNQSVSFDPPSVGIPSGSAHGSSHITSYPVVTPLPKSTKKTNRTVFMLTVYVKVRDVDGTYTLARALLDSASERNFVTENLAQRLRLKRTGSDIDVYGIGNTVQRVTQTITINLSSRISHFNADIDFLILPSLTRILPSVDVDITSWEIPNNLPLADPTFHRAHGIDMILGIQWFFSLLENDQITLGPQLPILRKTVFGYAIAGDHTQHNPIRTVVCNAAMTVDKLTAAVQRFWEVESFEGQSSLSLEEQYCENHFRTTHSRAPGGRYVVRLPIREELLSDLGESLPVAIRRFHAIERRLSSNRQLHSDYSKFINEYQSLGHMEEVLPDPSVPHFYLPHHAILRPESKTTKIRVVFDGSCKSASRISLNDLCYIGPTVQPPLISIILNFRLPTYVITADIEKMYRQVVVHQQDRPLQQIVWRNNPEARLQTFQLKTVTYGTSCAPFLATRVLNQLADDEAGKYPLASNAIKRAFYVDDCLTGDDSKERLIATCKQLTELLESGGFVLRKWSSSDPEIISHIPESLRDLQGDLEIDKSNIVKTLGLLWHPQSDCFGFKVPALSDSNPVTKRIVLSEMSRLFDPMGLVGAVIVSVKIFLQSLWLEKFTWDQPLPQDFQNWWKMFREEMQELSTLRIPRRVFLHNYANIQLHCFSDASDKAYGCCLYVTSSNRNGISITNLLMSKSRVCPLDKLSIPRAELCGAVMAAQLADCVRASTNLQCPITFWTDSSIVLHWLATSSAKWKVFVANRVAEIHRLTQGFVWRHIPTDLNPADRISRGVLPSRLIDDELWWHGPSFLNSDSSCWPKNIVELSQLHLQARELESRETVSLVVTALPSMLPLAANHSTLEPLQRKIAWTLRFIHNCRTNNRLLGPLSPAEIDKSLTLLVRQAQEECFAAEIRFLKQHSGPSMKNINFKSHLKNRNPFLDEKGLLRLYSRLCNQEIPFDTRYPIVLPQNHHLTNLIATNVHIRTLHSGPQLLLATLRQKFWPVRGRDLAKRVVKNCLVCFRCKPSSINQIMGQLPSVRVTPSRAFLKSGVDYCGPFFVRPPSRRGSSVKIFVAIFVCMASKAVHIEMVYGLSSASFINVLKRFVSRRGRTLDIYCDNARTFVGANRLLQDDKRLFDEVHSSQSLGKYCSENGIRFHFNPARSPHFGGLWESAVKIFKHHLYRIMKDTHLTIDDFNTLIIQIEGMMTPYTVVIGSCRCRRSNSRKMQQKVQHFWKVWSRDYIGQLQSRQRWPMVQPDIKVDTLVLLKKDSTPPMRWNLARVARVFPGPDGHVRVVDVKTAHGVYRRAITEICPLPIEDETPRTGPSPPSPPSRPTQQ
ncbi:uncharacterized protein LOC128732318 [Sabethes cyaneus]|uniref:uncharacterized protein LOC128732318 n=1 Tax=Sabethes cyaneus TaxID=53552 RepID=UPI00237DAC8F|nr:uncharacterized protein LOC128732318 [Sabethes cyaneus]